MKRAKFFVRLLPLICAGVHLLHGADDGTCTMGADKGKSREHVMPFSADEPLGNIPSPSLEGILHPTGPSSGDGDLEIAVLHEAVNVALRKVGAVSQPVRMLAWPCHDHLLYRPGHTNRGPLSDFCVAANEAFRNINGAIGTSLVPVSPLEILVNADARAMIADNDQRTAFFACMYATRALAWHFQRGKSLEDGADLIAACSQLFAINDIHHAAIFRKFEDVMVKMLREFRTLAARMALTYSSSCVLNPSDAAQKCAIAALKRRKKCDVVEASDPAQKKLLSDVNNEIFRYACTHAHEEEEKVLDHARCLAKSDKLFERKLGAYAQAGICQEKVAIIHEKICLCLAMLQESLRSVADKLPDDDVVKEVLVSVLKGNGSAINDYGFIEGRIASTCSQILLDRLGIVLMPFFSEVCALAEQVVDSLSVRLITRPQSTKVRSGSIVMSLPTGSIVMKSPNSDDILRLFGEKDACIVRAREILDVLDAFFDMYDDHSTPRASQNHSQPSEQDEQDFFADLDVTKGERTAKRCGGRGTAKRAGKSRSRVRPHTRCGQFSAACSAASAAAAASAEPDEEVDGSCTDTEPAPTHVPRVPHYARRVLRWFDTEFSKKCSWESAMYHTFAPLTDFYLINEGVHDAWRNEIRNRILHEEAYDDRYSMPGAIVLEGGCLAHVVFSCTVGRDGLVYHRGYRFTAADELKNKFHISAHDLYDAASQSSAAHARVSGSARVAARSKIFKMAFVEQDCASKIVIYDERNGVRIVLYRCPGLMH